jgi:hypothetical protein
MLANNGKSKSEYWVLRFAQDDGENKQRQKQRQTAAATAAAAATAKTTAQTRQLQKRNAGFFNFDSLRSLRVRMTVFYEVLFGRLPDWFAASDGGLDFGEGFDVVGWVIGQDDEVG